MSSILLFVSPFLQDFALMPASHSNNLSKTLESVWAGTLGSRHQHAQCAVNQKLNTLLLPCRLAQGPPCGSGTSAVHREDTSSAGSSCQMLTICQVVAVAD